MKLTSLVTTLLLASGLSLTSMAMADVDKSENKKAESSHDNQHNTRHRQHKERTMFMHHLRSLDLSTSQNEQVKLLMQQYKADSKSQRANKAQRTQMQTAIKQLMQADYFDQAQAEQLVNQQQMQQKQQQLLRLKLQYDVLQLLTPEQKEYLAALKSSRKHH
ncbi:Spy/CpxP family protein refolding chaperone [Rheinheimera sp. WS51]|uniref:Spy/CpxP family protein refolding chaperone n=1 Tax=Rheinheimera sp. WS51 TaxID=3425886 RepID=UPI003D8B80A0